MADILPINTWFCFDFVSSVHRVPFNNVQLQVYIIKIKIVLYTQLSQLSHISLELLKHNIIAMCCHTMYLGKKFFFHIIAQTLRSWKNTTSTSRTCALAWGRWFYPCTRVSSINKTDYHDITEILFKVALNTIILTQSFEFEHTSDYSRNTSYARN